MSSIQEAVNQAKEAAADMVANEAEVTSNQVIEAVASPAGVVTTFSKPSMATVAASTGVIPRSTAYLKVNEFGLRIGKHKEFITEFEGSISLIEDEGFQVKHTLRFGVPAQYLSTYDGQICDKGGSWHDAIMKARMADPQCEPYHSVDAVITLTKAIKLKDETLAVGTKLGFNASKSNFSEWSDFYAEAAKANKVGDPAVAVKIGFREINHGGNTWGVVTFAM